MHKNRFRLTQKGIYTYAIVGMLHMAGDCGGKKPKPATTVNTQDTKKPKRANSEASKTAQEIKQTQKETVTQQTSSPVGEAHVQSETVTKKVPVSQEEPKQTPSPKTPEEIAAEAMDVAQNAITALRDKYPTSEQVNGIGLEEELLSGIDKAVEAINQVEIPFDLFDSQNPIINGKYLADKARQNSIIQSLKKGCEEAIMAEIVFTELDKKTDLINDENERNEILKDIIDPFKTAIDTLKNDNDTANTLDGLKKAINTTRDHISAVANAIKTTSITSANKDVIVGELNDARAKLAEVSTSMNDWVTAYTECINAYKEAMNKGILATLLSKINVPDNKNDKDNDKDIEAIKQAIDNAITAVNKLP